MPEKFQTGLVLWLQFDEKRGNIVYDQSGLGNNGTIYGATFVNSPFLYALSFDGVDDYVRVILPSFPFNSFSISIWIYDYKHESYRYERHIGLYDANKNRMWNLYTTRFSPNNMYFEVWKPDGTSFPIDLLPTPLNQWTHYVITFDGTTYKGYVNGTFVSQISNVPPRDLGQYYLSIGSALGVDAAWSIIDEVRIYNRALSDEEIKQLYYDYIKKHYI